MAGLPRIVICFCRQCKTPSVQWALPPLPAGVSSEALKGVVLGDRATLLFDHRTRQTSPRVIRPVIRRPMREENEPSGVPRGSVSGTFRLIDLFARNHPASQEGEPEAWAFAMTVIDHGSFFWRQLDSFRSGSGLRDPVIQALFRRILITAEAIRSLLAHGLEEPAVATYRNLLELKRDLRLVMSDRSDTNARRLALFLAVKGRRSLAKATRNPSTRDLIKRDSDFSD